MTDSQQTCMNELMARAGDGLCGALESHCGMISAAQEAALAIAEYQKALDAIPAFGARM